MLPRVARLGGLHARRDAGAGHRHARHRRRRAEDRDGRGRDLQALHAALQLPAVLGRRSAVPARPRPPRNRPRRAGRARARADDADRGAVPLHGPHRLGHPRVQRLVVDGLGLRRRAGDDGRGRAAQGAGGRRGDGPGDGRGDRQVRRADRHRRRRGPLRRHGLQGRRHRPTGITALQMDIKVGGHHDARSCARRSSRRARAGSTSSTRWHEALARAARATSRRTRRASSRSRSRSTRSATSSGRAAR